MKANTLHTFLKLTLAFLILAVSGANARSSRTAVIAAVNPVIGEQHFSFDIVLTPTTIWEGSIYDKTLGDCSWFFEYNSAALTAPEITYTAPEIDSTAGYSNIIAIISNRLGLTTDVSLSSFNGTELFEGESYLLYTIRMEILDFSQNTGIRWDTLNTGLLTVLDNVIQPQADNQADIPLTPTGIGDDAISNVPEAFALHQNYPNPFNPATSVQFDMPVSSRVSVRVFDMLGRLITEITNDTYPAGSHIFRWNGLDMEGRKAASGLYLLNVEAADYSSTIKITMLK